jgi:general secretion pathway protein D
LKDGETQILAGLISDDERKSASKLPGLGDIPLLGRLFSNQQDQKTKTEIVLAITPRIISNIVRPDAEIAEYWSGTDTVITDKPQIGLPVSGTPLSPQEKFREQQRLRREQQNSAPPPQPPAEAPVEAAPVPVEIPQAAAPPNAAGTAAPAADAPPPIIDPANPPPAP